MTKTVLTITIADDYAGAHVEVACKGHGTQSALVPTFAQAKVTGLSLAGDMLSAVEAGLPQRLVLTGGAALKAHDAFEVVLYGSRAGHMLDTDVHGALRGVPLSRDMAAQAVCSWSRIVFAYVAVRGRRVVDPDSIPTLLADEIERVGISCGRGSMTTFNDADSTYTTYEVVQ